MKWSKRFLLSSVFIVSTAVIAQANEWIPVTGAEILKEFMSGIKVERTLAGGEISRGEYFSDGTGTLFSWSAQIPRTWEVKGDNQVCISAKRRVNCFQFERNSDNPNLYRALDVETGEIAEFEVTNGKIIAKAEAKDPGSGGGAAAPSADELAAELSNV